MILEDLLEGAVVRTDSFRDDKRSYHNVDLWKITHRRGQHVLKKNRNILFRALLLLFVWMPLAHADTQVVSLKKGWNLISTNLTDSRATSVIFEGVASEISTYSGGIWQTYNLTTSSGDFTVMPSHQGVWVKSTAHGNVTFEGSAATVDYSGLLSGWNMLAPGGQTTPQGLESAIESAGSNPTLLQIVVYMPGSGWSFHNFATGNSTLTALQEGEGVWVKVYIPPPAQTARTGQTQSYVATDDGALQVGVAWPTIRFTDNGDGTITDELTGLVWMKNADCWGTMSWAAALSKISALNGPSGCTGYTGTHSDWRLPNRRELRSLVDYGRYSPALPSGHPFTGVQTGFYWSSTTYANNTSYAWYVYLSDGYVSYGFKTGSYYVWPVRGGQ